MGDMMRASTEDFQTLFPLFVRSFYSTCIDYDADVIVPTSLALSFALDISEKLHIPCWSIKFVPDIPTRAFGPGGILEFSTFLIPIPIPIPIPKPKLFFSQF